MNSENQNDTPAKPFVWSKRAKVGGCLVAISIVPWLCIAALPFMAAETLPWDKAALATAFLVLGEAVQLAGLAIAGPDLLARLKVALGFVK